MAVLIDRYNEGNYGENIVNSALSFNSGTWTVASGTGTATLNTDNYIEGQSSLLIQNNVPASAITVTNSSQTTTIPTTGTYKISWFAKKNIALEVRELDVIVYQNGSPLATQTCTLGSTNADEDVNNLWQRFQSSVIYSFSKGDAITFQFSIKGATTSELTTFVWVDALMINLADRGNLIVPNYIKKDEVPEILNRLNSDEEAIRTTGVADQTLTDGSFTILDYESEVFNNSSENYTVSSDGRITVNKDGVYDISAGVVIRAGLVSPSQTTALGIFVNGELTAITSSENVLEVGAQRGHSISTQLELTSGDIVDARAFSESELGGVLDFLALLSPVLFGVNAQQVNHLAVVKCNSK